MTFRAQGWKSDSMRFAREGYPFMLVGLALASLAWALIPILGVWSTITGTLLTVLTAFVFYFFRDPEREHPTGDGLVLSPGDGKIIDIREVNESSFVERRCRRITIFLSVFNVHVQRAPAPLPSVQP